MAVDRVTLVEQILKGGQQPANSFTNPANFGSVAFDPEVAPWALTEEQGGTGYAAALEMAKELMAEAGYADGAGLTLTIGHNVSEGSRPIAQAIQAMWTAAFPSIQVNIETQEWAVYLDSIENDAPMELSPTSIAWVGARTIRMPITGCMRSSILKLAANRIMISADDPANRRCWCRSSLRL